MVTKSKKLHNKLRLYYRGPLVQLPKTAKEDELQLVIQTLKEFIENRQKIYRVTWQEKSILVKPVFGLDKTLRCLRRKQVRALIYDETTNDHLKGYFSQAADIAILEAKLSSSVAHKIGLTNLLVLSVIEVDSSDIKPEQVTVSDSFTAFCRIFDKDIPKPDPLAFKPPLVERVACTSKTHEKKLIRSVKSKDRRTIPKTKALFGRWNSPIDSQDVEVF